MYKRRGQDKVALKKLMAGGNATVASNPAASFVATTTAGPPEALAPMNLGVESANTPLTPIAAHADTSIMGVPPMSISPANVTSAAIVDGVITQPLLPTDSVDPTLTSF